MRRDTGESYQDFLTTLGQASGIETPTRADRARMDRQRKKKGSNDDWTHPHDPDAKITRMKDGRTHLAHKAEHAVDLETGAIVGITVQDANEGDTTTSIETLIEAAEQVEAVRPWPSFVVAVWYSVAVPHMNVPPLDGELKKGSAEFLILSLVEDRALHGYDIARLIDVRSKGALTFYAASLYPLLYRLERRGWITGRWLEQAGARRRRMYRITAAGRRVLAAHRTTWDAFVRAVNLVTGTDHA